MDKLCQLCGQYHHYSDPCPNAPTPKQREEREDFAIELLEARIIHEEEMAGLMASSEDPAGTRDEEVRQLRANADACRRALDSLRTHSPEEPDEVVCSTCGERRPRDPVGMRGRPEEPVAWRKPNPALPREEETVSGSPPAYVYYEHPTEGATPLYGQPLDSEEGER